MSTVLLELLAESWTRSHKTSLDRGADPVRVLRPVVPERGHRRPASTRSRLLVRSVADRSLFVANVYQ